jgi:hypothetical protein
MKNKFSVLAAIACLVVLSFVFAACTNKLLPPKDIGGLMGYSFEDEDALLSIEFTRASGEEQGCLMVWDLPGILYSILDLGYTKQQDGLYYGTLIISLRDGDNSSFSRKLLVIDNQGNKAEEVISFRNKDSLAFEIGYDNNLKRNIMIVTVENGSKWILQQQDYSFRISSTSSTLDSNSSMKYRIEMGSIIITDYIGSEKDLIIPNEINGKPVVAIDANIIFQHSFYEKQLTSVIIPESVSIIDSEAFAKNQLSSIIIPNNVTIVGYRAFAENQLTNIIIPSSVINIDGYAFVENQLTNVIIPSGVINIGDYAFAENQLTNVIIPNSVINIGKYAFYDNRLNSVIIPEGVKRIGYGAFSGNNLKNITLPDSVETIEGGYTFGIDLTSISVSENHPYFKSIDGVLFSKDGKTSVAYPAGKRGSSYIIPNGVTTIGDMAFSVTRNLNITIPNSVTSIGHYSFWGMLETIDSIIIPDSVVSIKGNAFGSTYLRRITIGENVALNVDGPDNGSFSQDFDEFYNNNGKMKGTYSFVGNLWDGKWEYGGN